MTFFTPLNILLLGLLLFVLTLGTWAVWSGREDKNTR